MIINIGNTIKNLRVQKHATQDQLATFLGVTPQAISRWEAGNGYPDIELLPMIADYFAVTTDELLGIKKEERAAKLAIIYKEIKRCEEEAIIDERTLQYVRNAVAEFPSEIRLQKNLADEICRLYMWEPTRDVTKLDEAEKLYEIIIETCADTDMKNQTLESLCALYSHGYKDDKKAKSTVERLPQMKYSREWVMATGLFEGDDTRGVYYLQNYINRLASDLGSRMLQCVIGDNIPNGSETWEKKLGLLDDIITIYHIVYGENLNYHHYSVAQFHRVKATYLVAMERFDETLDELEKMCAHSIKCCESKAGDKFTSHWTDQITQPEPSDDFDWFSIHNDAYYELQKMEQERYNPIREMSRFKDIIVKLREIAM
jgi:Predicted transcriptional regulators